MSSIKEFQIINKLGEGAYSQVYKVKRLSDKQIYALKKVSLDPLSQKERENALNEVRILASIKHPNVIGYKEAFLEDEKFLNIIMDYADDGDLYQKITEHQKNKTQFEEDEVWKVFIHMVRGLKALHNLKIFHRDMKSANVFLLKDGTAKLGDLNVSKVAKKGLLYTQTGTPYYASPEVWKDQPYDHKSDVWSLGCVLYEIVTLQPPFRANDMDGLFKKVLKGIYPKIPTNYTDELNKLIKKLITVNPNQRPTCEQILSNDIIQKWTKKLGLSNDYQSQNTTQDQDDGLGGNLTLLNTIKLPKNLKLLSDRLPKSKYEEEAGSEVRSLLNEVSSTKSLKTSPDEYKPAHVIRTGGRKAHPNGVETPSRRSAMSEERKQLKRNASENLQNLPLKNPAELIIGGEKLRDKNSQDYLETIRENEGIQLRQRKRQNKILTHDSSSEDSYINSYDVKSDGKHYQPPQQKRNYAYSLVNHNSVAASNQSQDNLNNNAIIVNRIPITKPHNPKHSIDLSTDRMNNEATLPYQDDQHSSNKRPKNLKILYQEMQQESNQQMGQPKKRRRGPLIHKAIDLFPSIERSVKNQSDLSLKLPDIKRPYEMSNRELSINYTEDKKEKLRHKLEKLYQVKVPKFKRENGTANKPPMMAKKAQMVQRENGGNQGMVIVTDNGIPPLRPQWWG